MKLLKLLESLDKYKILFYIIFLFVIIFKLNFQLYLIIALIIYEILKAIYENFLYKDHSFLSSYPPPDKTESIISILSNLLIKNNLDLRIRLTPYNLWNLTATINKDNITNIVARASSPYLEEAIVKIESDFDKNKNRYK